MSKKQHKNSSDVAVSRYGWLSFGLLIVFGCIIYFILKIKYVEGDVWRQLGVQETVKKDRIVRPNRGNIYGDDGRLLATSEPLYGIYIDFLAEGIIEDSLKNNLNPLSTALAKKFPSKTSSQYKKILQDGWDLSRKEKAAIARARKEGKPLPKVKSRRVQLLSEKINYLDLKELKTFPYLNQRSNRSGLVEEEFTKRMKPFGRIAGRTIGSLSSDFETGGESGLELKYNDLLKGQTGLKTRQKVKGRWIDVIIEEPIDGMDIETTINVDYQDLAERSLYAKLAETDAESGCAIVMEVKTGEIKAITNLDRIRDGVYAEGKPNAFSYMSEPGSTFKTISLLIALEDGVVTPETIIDAGRGLYQYGNRTVRDHDADKGRDKSSMTVTEGMYNSSNVVLAKMILKGYEKEPNKFAERIHELGMGKSLEWDVPLKGKEGSINIRFKDDAANPWSKTTLPWMSFGYETQVPPIYMLMFYNGIANNGRMVKPFLTKAFWADGKRKEVFEAEVINKSMASNKTIEQVQTILRGVVTNGTGKAVNSKIVSIAGKTGTAQIASQGSYAGGHFVSFVGYFPADNPKYTCFVGIRRPKGVPSGGLMPGAVFKNIAEGITTRETVSNPILAPVDTLHQKMPFVKNGLYENAKIVLEDLDINFDESDDIGRWIKVRTDSTKVRLSNHQVADGNMMPNVVGMGLRDAIFTLENHGLVVHVKGAGGVRTQSIAPNTRISKGSKVTIELN